MTEQHLVRPTDVNGINKVAGEYYHLVYNNVFGVRACSLRLTNVYGPRQLIRHNRQGFIGWFIRLALEDQEIQVFGDGSQIRDFVYVDDAVDAFLRGGRHRRRATARSSTSAATSTSRIATWSTLLVELAGSGRYRFVEWPRREEGDRHRQLLRRLVAVRSAHRLDAGGAAARRLRAHPRRTTGSTSRHYVGIGGSRLTR